MLCTAAHRGRLASYTVIEAAALSYGRQVYASSTMQHTAAPVRFICWLASRTSSRYALNWRCCSGVHCSKLAAVSVRGGVAQQHTRTGLTDEQAQLCSLARCRALISASLLRRFCCVRQHSLATKLSFLPSYSTSGLLHVTPNRLLLSSNCSPPCHSSSAMAASRAPAPPMTASVLARSTTGADGTPCSCSTPQPPFRQQMTSTARHRLAANIKICYMLMITFA